MLTSRIPANAESLLKNRYDLSDMVVAASILSISGPFTDDLGTDSYVVQLHIRHRYKQRFKLLSDTLQLQWEVNQADCTFPTTRECISQFEHGEYIYFLGESVMHQSIEFHKNHILPVNDSLLNELKMFQQTDKIQIDHYGRNKSCSASCRLCKAIWHQHWRKVKYFLANDQREENSPAFMQHRAIKWILPDQSILASLPSYMCIRYAFYTKHGEVEACATYQVGYTMSFASWIPNLLYRMGGIQAYKYFTKEKTDTMILLKFDVEHPCSSQYLYYLGLNNYRLLTDSSQRVRYGDPMPLSQEMSLLTAVFDGPFRFYLDYQSMPDYHDRGIHYIDELFTKKQVYLLCLMANHTIPEIAQYSIEKLGELNDANCVPFLIQLAQYKCEWIMQQAKPPEEYREYLIILSQTLNAMTGCKSNFSQASDIVELTGETEAMIPVWQARIFSQQHTTY